MTQATASVQLRPNKPFSEGQKASAKAVGLHTADSQSALLALLKTEADVRNVDKEHDLVFLMANETRKLTRARQVFVLRRGLTGAFEVAGISSLSVVDRNAPLVALIERVAASEPVALATAQPTAFDLPADDPIAQAYPFRGLLWLPLKHGDRDCIGALILARETPWQEADTVVARRLSATYAHAWSALRGQRRRSAGALFKVSRWHGAASLAAIAALFLVKVPMSALAPVEIVPQRPFVIAAPIDGVIERVVVDVNQQVAPDDLLVRFADTSLRNRLEVAEREVEVAGARLKQANQLAFTDVKGLHDLGIARSELQLKIAERNFARDLLAKTEVRASTRGVAMIGDKRELTGKPVAVGEKILEIADPERLEARISLPVADAITLRTGAPVKLFLDSDPLRPWTGLVTHADYKARPGENDAVTFRVTAALAEADGGRPLPRLGVRGTAQVFSDDVALGFYLFRRPITAARQWLGL